MKGRAMLESNPSNIWGFAREWCLTVPLFFVFAKKFGLRIKHHSLGKTEFDKLRGFGGWPPFL